MAIRQRANSVIYQVSFIIVRAKGDFILFDGVELMFKWSYSVHGMHKFSFFKQTIYIVLILTASFFTPLTFFISSFFSK